MKKILLFFFVFFGLNAAQAWEVVEDGVDHRGDQKWKLNIQDEAVATGDDKVMWGYIRAFVDIFGYDDAEKVDLINGFLAAKLHTHFQTGKSAYKHLLTYQTGGGLYNEYPESENETEAKLARYDWLMARSLPQFLTLIGKLTFLKDLKIEQSFDIFPEEFFALKNLWRLDLSGSSIKILPESIGVFKDLYILDLRSSHELVHIPHSVLNLAKARGGFLEIFDLRWCHALVEESTEDAVGLRELRDVFGVNVKTGAR